MRDYRIDSVRVFCNILLVVTHAYPAMYSMGKDAEYWFITFVSMKFCIMLLPTLFLLSGYLFFGGYGGAGLGVYFRKICARVRRLLVPFWAWNFIYVLVFLFLGLISSRSANRLELVGCNNLVGVLKNCFLNPFDAPVAGPVWYLRAVFVFCLASPIIYIIISHVNRYLLVLMLGIMVVFYGKYPSQYPMYGLAAFVIGGMMSYHQINLVDFFLKRRYAFLGVSLTSVTVAFLMHYLGYTGISEPADIFKFLCIPMFWCLADWIHRLMTHDFIKKWIMPAAFTIYCCHSLVNSIAMHALGLVIPAFHGRMLIISTLTIIIDIVVSVGIWNLLNKFSPRLLKVIDGRL